MDLNGNIKNKIRNAWCRETCYPKSQDKWNINKPELGQCAVTSLLLHDLIGGQIVFNKKWNHFWIIDKDNNEIDLTKSQFDTNEKFEVNEIFPRENFKQETLDRYLLLKYKYEQQK